MIFGGDVVADSDYDYSVMISVFTSRKAQIITL